MAPTGPLPWLVQALPTVPEAWRALVVLTGSPLLLAAQNVWRLPVPPYSFVLEHMDLSAPVRPCGCQMSEWMIFELKYELGRFP